jgi:capsular exopolysaccharide synthesis family protein
MMSQDNRLLSLSAVERGLDRPLTPQTQPKPYDLSSTDTAHLRDYLFVVLKRKWLILTLVVVVTSLVTIQMYRMPSTYEAATTIQIEPKKDSILKTDKGIVINTGSDKDPAYWNTQLKLLENPALARQVILTLDLQHNSAFFTSQAQTGIMASLRRLFGGETKAPAAASPAVETGLPVVTPSAIKEQQLTPEELARLEPYEDTLAANLTVEPVTGTNLVTLHYKHTDPELAQKIVNTFADVFVFNNLERETSGSAKAEEVLAGKIAELQQSVHSDEEKRFNYIKNNNLPQTKGPGSDLSAERLAKLSGQLLDAENKRKNLQALYESAASQTDAQSVPDVQDNKRIQSLREKLDALGQRREELLQIYTPEWPEVKKIDAQIKLLEESLAKAPREVLSAMKSRYEAAVAEERSLRQAYNQQLGEFSGQNQAMLQLSMLDQQIETNKQYLNTLLQKQREIENTSTDTLKTNNVNVAQYSRLPRAPIGPARVRNIVVAFLLSLGLGIGLAFLLNYLDDTLKSIEDVDRYIHLPALALIPSNRTERTRLGKGAPSNEPDESTALALIDDVRSPMAEAYRHLRTSLLLSSAGQPPKTILVTSSQPSEGKTTTAVNTAVMLAQTGAEVVIVDCDLRRPRLHSHFNVPNIPGVTNYLSGESDLEALLQPCEKLANLKLLTSGPVPPNPAELLGSNEMRKLLGQLSERFAHVIVDSPPAISFTDASILSTMVDGVVLVVHGGRSSRAVVRRAKQLLLDVGANIFGVVLNNVKLESTNYYYYAGYYSSYYTDDDRGADAGVSADAGASGTRL